MQPIEGGFFVPRNALDRSDLLYQPTSPLIVAAQTTQALDLYFGNHLPDPKIALEYLAESTLPFLRYAQNGLYLAAEGGRFYSFETREFFQDVYLEEPAGIPEETAAFHASIVAFGKLPERIKGSNLPRHMLTRENFQPPDNPIKYKRRLRELEWQVDGIINKQIGPESSLDLPLARTYMFFRTLSEVPLKLAPSAAEEQEKARVQSRANWNKLLGEIDISL